MGMLGAMQDFPLRIMRLMDHAEREHGTREIVAARPDGNTVRTNWIEVAAQSRRLAQALELPPRVLVGPGPNRCAFPCAAGDKAACQRTPRQHSYPLMAAEREHLPFLFTIDYVVMILH